MGKSGTLRQPPPVDTSNWLTYSQASALCKISENTLRAWVAKGVLVPAKVRRTYLGGVTREVNVFDPADLAKHVARRRAGVVSINSPGEVAASAFELFDAGTSLREVVVQLRETPARVSQLHDEWLEFGGADLVIGKEARRELEGLVGPFLGVSELVVLVSEAVRRQIEVTVEEGSPLAQASDAEVEHAIERVIERPLDPDGADCAGQRVPEEGAACP